MPTISYFFGIFVKMYYREHNPPHIHAYYQGFEAIYDIITSKKKKGNMPLKADRIICEWIVDSRVELLDNWNRMQNGLELYKIKGADQ